MALMFRIEPGDLLRFMRSMSHREYLMWVEFLEAKQYEHSLTDLYLMKLCCEVRRSYVKNPGRVKLSDFEVKRPSKKRTNLSVEEATRVAQMKWFGITGFREGKTDGK